MRRRQGEVVTFKADETLLEAMQGIPNRSEFIRNAVLHAMENFCPVCKGTGILTPNQKRHWEAFARDHQFKECDDCHEYGLVCRRKGPRRRVRHGPEMIVLDMSKDPTPAELSGDPYDLPMRVILEDLPKSRKRGKAKAGETESEKQEVQREK